MKYADKQYHDDYITDANKMAHPCMRASQAISQTLFILDFGISALPPWLVFMMMRMRLVNVIMETQPPIQPMMTMTIIITQIIPHNDGSYDDKSNHHL